MTRRDPYRVPALLARLTPRDLRILEDVERFRLLSSDQIRRLQFGEGHVGELAATRGAIRVLGRLEQLGLLARLKRRIGGPLRGSSATIWQLGAAGERLLRARRGEAARRRFQEPSHTFIEHQLAVSELAVRVIQTVRARGLDLLTIETEPGCWRSFVNPAGGLAWVKPDLALVIADAASETHTWVEVDRDTEHLPAVVRKCAVYQRYYATGVEQAAHGVYPLVVWSVPDDRRADQIRRVIAAEPRLDDRLFTVVTNADALEPLVPPG